MRPSLAVFVALALTLLLTSCTMIDVRMAPRGGVHSDAFISGYADAGWPASDSLIKLGLFDGPSPGALFYFQLWKLFRFEAGFLGLALGVGPLDAGVGVLLYEPQPPTYVEDLGHDHDEDAECCEDWDDDGHDRDHDEWAEDTESHIDEAH